MFCPKCGTRNPDDGKFCRSCGTDLGGVSAVLSGGIHVPTDNAFSVKFNTDAKPKNDPTEVFADAVRHIIFGFGFLVISIVLFLTNVANGQRWWWAMLFPAFSFLAKGVSDYVKAGRLERTQAFGSGEGQRSPAQLHQPANNPGLPPSMTDYAPAPESRYKTGDLVPPSVTDNTTRHLEMNREGETMTLPKK